MVDRQKIMDQYNNIKGTGSNVEYCYRIEGHWSVNHNPAWDWNNYDYRIKVIPSFIEERLASTYLFENKNKSPLEMFLEADKNDYYIEPIVDDDGILYGFNIQLNKPIEYINVNFKL